MIPLTARKKVDATLLSGASFAVGPQTAQRASILVDGGRVTRMMFDEASPFGPEYTKIDLSGFLVVPGLINAHDHLQFALHPRLGKPPYRNYVDWGEDIHASFRDAIAKYKSIDREVRLWWGGIRNLLCGVTTVCHHDKLWPTLQREDFPVKVVQHFGWAHSLALGGDLRAARAATPEGSVFIMHACEGVDNVAKSELHELDRLGLLDSGTVLVHGLALNSQDVAVLKEREVSLVVCPSSNNFLFRKVPDTSLFHEVKNIALGSDSPLTADGNLLDEVRFAVKACGITPAMAYRMVTVDAAKVLQLKDGVGTIQEMGAGDCFAVRDTGAHVEDTLPTLSMEDVEFVMVEGRVQLASGTIYRRLPSVVREGLEPLMIGETVRWLRAPVNELLRKAEEVLGKGEVRLGGHVVCSPLS